MSVTATVFIIKKSVKMKALILVVLVCIVLEAHSASIGSSSSMLLPDCVLNESGHPTREVKERCELGRCLKTKVAFLGKAKGFCCCTNWSKPE